MDDDEIKYEATNFLTINQISRATDFAVWVRDLPVQGLDSKSWEEWLKRCVGLQMLQAEAHPTWIREGILREKASEIYEGNLPATPLIQPYGVWRGDMEAFDCLRNLYWNEYKFSDRLQLWNQYTKKRAMQKKSPGEGLDLSWRIQLRESFASLGSLHIYLALAPVFASYKVDKNTMVFAVGSEGSPTIKDVVFETEAFKQAICDTANKLVR